MSTPTTTLRHALEAAIKAMIKDAIAAKYSTVSVLRSDETHLVNGTDYLAVVVEAEQESNPISTNLTDYRKSAFGFGLTIEVQSSAKKADQDAQAEEIYLLIYEYLQQPNLPTSHLSRFAMFWIMPVWKTAIETDPDGRRTRTWETRLAAEEARS